MRSLATRTVPLVLCVISSLLVTAQSTEPEEARLAKIRASYDAPFQRNLGPFDCAVQFDWNHHLTTTFGSVPPAIVPVIERLQKIQRRVLVDRREAVVSQNPKVSDLSSFPAAATLEFGLESMVAAGLNSWLPYATNVILPVSPTSYHFETAGSDTKLTMNGPGVSATLSLLPDGRLTGGLSDKPQPLHFATEFTSGPQGFLLSSMKVGSGNSGAFESSFAYHYETVDGFQLPTHFTVRSLIAPASAELWEIELQDCKVNRSMTIQVNPPLHQ